MSGSPELLFPDGDVLESSLPTRPRELAQPIAKKSSAVVPSNRKLGFLPAKSDHVAIRVAPIVPTTFVPTARKVGPPPIPAFYDPTGRKLRTSMSAFRINPDSVVKSPLRRTKKAGRRHSTRRVARAYRNRKASRPSTRASLRR